jgi:hypothetical protein
MKPGDHPDFFRLPPPPGRSRESRIVLDAEGRFWNAGIPIDHEGMAVAFASWIRRHPDDGRFILTNGYDWTYFTVEDAPFIVRHVTAANGGALLSLFDGSEEPLDPSTVVVSERGILYATVRGDCEARFSPAAQSEMVDFVGEGPGGEPRVEIGPESHPILPRKALPERPGPSAAAS